jgi:zinc protease
VYKQHPYQWPTIGKDLSHIEKAQMEDVQQFFQTYYNPSNAILSISGAISSDDAIRLVEKWYGDIPSGKSNKNIYPFELTQTEQRFESVERDVPQNILLKAYLMPERTHANYYVYDVISELLSGGKTARLYNELVKKNALFTDISAFVTASLSQGMFVVSGRLADGVNMDKANQAVNQLLNDFSSQIVKQDELEKCINNVMFSHAVNSIGVLNKAMNLAYFEMLEDANLFNSELDKYKNVSAEQVQKVSSDLFRKNKENLLYYLKK